MSQPPEKARKPGETGAITRIEIENSRTPEPPEPSELPEIKVSGAITGPVHTVRAMLEGRDLAEKDADSASNTPPE